MLNLFAPPAGLLAPEQEEALRQQMQMQGLLGLASGLFQAGTPSRTPQSLGGSALQGLMAGQQMASDTFTQTLRAEALRQQMEETRRKRAEEEAIKRFLPQIYQAPRPTTQEVIPSEQGDDVLTRPGTPGGINYDALRQLAIMYPERGGKIAESLEKLSPKLEKVDLNNTVAFVDPRNPTNIVVSIPKGIDPEKTNQTELKIYDDFSKAATPYVGIAQAYKKIEASAQNPSAAGDLSLIFNYMKILDPGSVVREGEFATAQNAAGVPDVVKNLYNRVIEGTRLGPEQRNDFLNQSRNLVASQQELFRDSVLPRFDTQIQNYRLNRQNIVFDPFAGIDTSKVLATPKPEADDRKKKLRQTLFPERNR